jgi:hypothetical protein
MKILESNPLRIPSLKNLALFAIALSLGLGLWLTTPNGLGLTPDSVAYLKAAQGMSQGLGFDYFSMQWPPGYSSLMYFVGTLTGNDVIRSARIVNVTAYALLFYTLARILERCCGISLIAAVMLTSLICLHPVTTHIFFYALSEPVFLLIVLINITLLINYTAINKPLSLRAKFCLILVGCSAVSFRYAGLTVVALNIWFVVTHNDKRVTKLNTWLEVLLQALPALLLVSIWRLHRGLGDSVANERPLVLHLATAEDIRYGLVQIGGWFVSPGVSIFDLPNDSIQYFAGLVICGLLMMSFLWATANALTQSRNASFLSVQLDKMKCIWILSTYVCGYIAFLLLIRSLFDPNIVFDNRTLSPLFLSTLVILITACYLIEDRKYRNIAVIILSVMMFIQTHNFKSWVLLSYFNGVELNDKIFKARPINLFVTSCGKNTAIAADKPWSFNLHFSTMVFWLPQYYQYGSGLLNMRYKQEISQLASTKDLLVVETVNSDIVKEIDTLDAFHRIYSADDGIVWQNRLIASRLCVGGR